MAHRSDNNNNNGNNNRRRRGRTRNNNSNANMANRTPSTENRRAGRNTRNVVSTSRKKQSRGKESAKVTQQIKSLNRRGVTYDGQGLTMISLETIKRRLQLEQIKCNYFDQGKSRQIVNGNNPISITPARIALGADEYNMLNSSTMFDSKKMMKMMAQINTISQQGSNVHVPLNSYDDLFGDVDSNASANASLVDSLSSDNITFQRRNVTRVKDTLGGARPGASGTASTGTEDLGIYDFPDIPSSAVKKCLIDHFINPGEHLGVQTHFLRENLLIEDITKDDCNDCTIEGLEDNYGDVDLSALVSLAMPQSLSKTAAAFAAAARETIQGSGNLIENIFTDEDLAPVQVQTVYDSFAAMGASDSETEEAPFTSVGGVLTVSVYAAMIQYIDVFMGYMVGEPDDSGESVKLMKSPIFTPLTEEILQTLETASLPVLCRLRPYAAPYESFELEYFEDFEPPLTDALPIFNSCFILTPGELSDFVSEINPAVQTDLYTEGCEFYYIAGDGMSQEYVGLYHIHYDGTIMTEATHNPEVNHDILYKYCDTPTPDRPEGCEPCPDVETDSDDDTRIDPEGDPRGRFFENFIANLDDIITGYFDTGGPTKSAGTLDTEIKYDAGGTQDAEGNQDTTGLGSGGSGGPSGGGSGY